MGALARTTCGSWLNTSKSTSLRVYKPAAVVDVACTMREFEHQIQPQIQSEEAQDGESERVSTQIFFQFTFPM